MEDLFTQQNKHWNFKMKQHLCHFSGQANRILSIPQHPALSPVTQVRERKQIRVTAPPCGREVKHSSIHTSHKSTR